MEINAKVFDIEVMKELFYYLDYDINTEEFTEFEVSKDKNDLFAMIKYITDKSFDYLIGFNSLNYDSQVIQYIIENYHNWEKYTSE